MKLPWRRPHRIFAALFHDRQGAIAVMFALLLVPLLLAIGTATDFVRALQVQTALQGAVDSAALAGASVYVSTATAATARTVATNYLQSMLPTLPANLGVTYTVTPAQIPASGPATGYTVTVTAQAQVATSIMALVTDSVGVGASGTAENPLVTGTADFSGWSSSAYDLNVISWYIVPADNSVPPASALHQIYSNAITNNPTPSFSAAASQRIGFAMKNVTGGLTGYGPNGEGAAQGSTHMFYSHLNPPSSVAYPSLKQNCSLQSMQVTNTKSPPQASQGSCFSTSSPSPYAAPSCSQMNGKPVKFAWNDLGGTSDDKDYNDAVYTLSCSLPSGHGGSGPQSVVLLR
jgi:Flp pilus assembly protein TadG